jgi:hypothetical protein
MQNPWKNYKATTTSWLSEPKSKLQGRCAKTKNVPLHKAALFEWPFLFLNCS